MAFKKKKKNDREAMDEALSVPVLQLGDEVPEVTCDSTMGMFNLHDVVDGAFSVIVTFLFPFDPVGTTELALLAKLKDEFDQRDAKLVALCVDTKENHRKWIEDVQELQEVVVWFPIIADENAEISRLLNLVKPMVRAVRPTVHGFLCRSFGFIYFLGDRPLRGVFLSLSFCFLPSLPNSLTHSISLSLSSSRLALAIRHSRAFGQGCECEAEPQAGDAGHDP
mmetsp:Transcript_22579/g.50954  ORF Transcript_22579/g.50954 Transcript_22579/m.50954 type:complete len:223 (-) Transcript_22579:538-1206(-)